MKRQDFIKLATLSGLGLYINPRLFAQGNLLSKASFGSDFKWGITTAAYQIEGAWNSDGKGKSIWDVFTENPSNIKDKSNGTIACDYYNSYKNDILLLKSLGFDSYRFSLSWSRILPEGIGTINQKGIDFYHKVIDCCIENGITPWITLYHWDLPQVLELKGGWTNREMIDWFSEYTEICAKNYGDKVKNWIILNEPMGFTSLGYMTGLHAPGKKGLGKFLPAVHHAALCQAEGGRILRSTIKDVQIGTTFSCAPVEPKKEKEIHENAAKRLDALLNRLFVEPAVGMGYPVKDLPLLRRIEKYIKDGDEAKLKFDFDFIGLQNYFRVISRFSLYPPVIWANEVKPEKRDVALTAMNWEIHPEAMYKLLKKFSAYPVKKLYITENGAAFKDELINEKVNDIQRINYFKDYLTQVLKAKNEGIPVAGYFVWTLMDNFEWAEGYDARFGLIYTDFKTQQRYIKDSGFWFKEFLGGK